MEIIKTFEILAKPHFRMKFEEHESKKAVNIINKYNGKKGLFKTVYAFDGEPLATNAIIDKIFLDFDPADDKSDKFFRDVRITCEYLDEKNYKYTVFFSGRGFHVYVYVKKTKARELDNATMAIKTFRNKLVEETEVNGIKVEIDPHVVGDLRRVSRIPNTRNNKTGLFCIPLYREELFKPLDEIKSIAETQRYLVNAVSGEELVDLKDFDFFSGSVKITPSNVEVDMGDADLEELPACVRESLLRGDPGFKERFLIIVALRDLGYSQEDVESLLGQHLTQEKFYHCVHEERQVAYLFSRADLIFPNCKSIESDGYCVQHCEGQKIYI